MKTSIRSAFTAIELLIVIAIMVMMIGLAVPSMAESLQRTKVANAANAIQEAHKQARQLARETALPILANSPNNQPHFGVRVTGTYAEVTYGGAPMKDENNVEFAHFDFQKGSVAVSGGAQANVTWLYQYGTGYPCANSVYTMPGSITDAVNIGVSGGIVGDLQVRTVDATSKGKHHAAIRIFKTGACYVELE